MAGAHDEDPLPRWAPRGGTAADEPLAYAWVDDDDSLRVLVLNTTSERDRKAIAARCRAFLDGEEVLQEFWGESEGLHELAALLMVGTEGGIGYGPLGRNRLRPLADLLEAALHELGGSV